MAKEERTARIQRSEISLRRRLRRRSGKGPIYDPAKEPYLKDSEMKLEKDERKVTRRIWKKGPAPEEKTISALGAPTAQTQKRKRREPAYPYLRKKSDAVSDTPCSMRIPCATSKKVRIGALPLTEGNLNSLTFLTHEMRDQLAGVRAQSAQE